MTDITMIPEHMPRHESACRGFARSNSARKTELEIGLTGVAHPSAASKVDEQPTRSCLLQMAEGAVPTRWWRTLPAGVLGITEYQQLRALLDRLHVLRGDGDVVAALNGDAAAAIEMALSIAPVQELSLTADIVMTGLMACALNRNAAAALVLAQILSVSELTELDYGRARTLSAAWFDFGLQHSKEPDKFREAWPALLTALGDRSDAKARN
jgi:hypothetical protein